MEPSNNDVSFKTPPLVEVSISVQFDPLANFHVGKLGKIWAAFEEEYPHVQHAAPLEHHVEKFGVIERQNGPQLKFMQAPDLPRVCLSNEAGDFLVQFQEDRFILNWRKIEQDTAYPRHEPILERFLTELGKFKEIVKETLMYDQIEMTYVNHIVAESHSVSDVFRELLNNSHFKNPTTTESFSINLKQLLEHEDSKIGRLYTSIEKAQRVTDNSELYVLKFTTRAHPLKTNSDEDRVIPVISLMRDVINSSFSAITTKEMHGIWNKED